MSQSKASKTNKLRVETKPKYFIYQLKRKALKNTTKLQCVLYKSLSKNNVSLITNITSSVRSENKTSPLVRGMSDLPKDPKSNRR